VSKLKIVAVAIVLAVILDLGIGLYLRTGTIMARSRNINVPGQPTIVIRELRAFPIWAFPLIALDDNPPYRFECYRYSYPQIWSCQSYTGESHIANTAEIEWASDGTATVSLDHIPHFRCKEGVWSHIP
jgi:hypothetical protein